MDSNTNTILPFHEAVEPLFPEIIVSISDLIPGLGDVVQLCHSLEVDLEWKISVENVSMLFSIL